MCGIFSWDTSYTFRDSNNQTKKQMLLSCETAVFLYCPKTKCYNWKKRIMSIFEAT